MMKRKQISCLHYERLVQSIARKYSNGKPYHEDIVQVGMLGLLGQFGDMIPNLVEVSKHLQYRQLSGKLNDFMRDKTWAIHVPRRIKELGPKIKAAVETLTTEMQRSPLVSEIAEYLDVDEEVGTRSDGNGQKLSSTFYGSYTRS